MGCMGRWLWTPVQRSDRSSRRHNHVGDSPSLVQPRVPIHVFGVEVFGHQDRQSPAKEAVWSDPISGREGEE